MDNIKLGLMEIVWGGADLIGPAQYRYNWKALVKAVMKPRVLYNAEKLSSG
jgi:hypothetical protein